MNYYFSFGRGNSSKRICECQELWYVPQPSKTNSSQSSITDYPADKMENLTAQQKDDLTIMIEYLGDSNGEAKNYYQESNKEERKNHIYARVLRIAEALGGDVQKMVDNFRDMYADGQCDECKDFCALTETDDGKVLCEDCHEQWNKDHDDEYYKCEICEEEYSMDNYAGCCSDGDCKFGHEKLCFNCVQVLDEEEGVPTCVKCLGREIAK